MTDSRSSKGGYEKAVQSNRDREVGLKPTERAARRERAVERPAGIPKLPKARETKG